MSKMFLKDMVILSAVAKRLENCKKVSQFDAGEKKEAWELVHHLADMEEACRNFCDNLIPKILNKSLQDHETENVLLEIGEEFRHIMYHITNSNFFGYLK